MPRSLFRQLPLVPTVLVLVAVAFMLRLGFWQLDRRAEKAALVARYEAASTDDTVVEWPADPERAAALLYRHARLDCTAVTGRTTIAGRSATDEAGLAQVVTCRTSGGQDVKVALGWSRAPDLPDWRGGEVTGIIAPGPRLVADPPLAGLAANARPDPADIPDNHLSYAVQWFFFAIAALAIYIAAARRRGER